MLIASEACPRNVKEHPETQGTDVVDRYFSDLRKAFPNAQKFSWLAKDT